MGKSSNIFKFRKNATIGALAAEQDTEYLAECFVDLGLVEFLTLPSDYRRIVLGRTGSGKTALFLRVMPRIETITVNPDELALDHLSNSALLQQLDSWHRLSAAVALPLLNARHGRLSVRSREVDTVRLARLRRTDIRPGGAKADGLHKRPKVGCQPRASG